MGSCILAHFAGLEDPRIERKKLHALNDILFLVVSAMLSGAEGWEAIEEFGHEKLDWLRKFIALKNGIPSADCLAYVMSRLSVDKVQDCFRSLLKELTEKLAIKHIAIDGKTSRGSRDRKRNRSALHLASAWACEAGLVFGQEVVDSKSNEIKAIPNLLEVLELKGCLITLDAMGCQTDIAEKIVATGADYVIGLKGNQGNLHESVEDFFVTAQKNGFKGVKYDSYEELDKEHGRL